MRFFNTAGPVKAERHYCIPSLERLDLAQLLRLIGQGKYFVLHAPRQTGKTSALLALRDHLNTGEDYRCAYVNVEPAQAAREDVAAAMRTILTRIAGEAETVLGDPSVRESFSAARDTGSPFGMLEEVLRQWAAADARPLVLLIDEIDALVGDTLVSVLRQLRAGYPERPGRFPQGVILCGVRDVRDYRIHVNAGRDVITGGSAFNIKAESLRLADFSEGRRTLCWVSTPQIRARVGPRPHAPRCGG